MPDAVRSTRCAGIITTILTAMTCAWPPAAAGQVDVAGLPDAADSVGAYFTLRDWVDRFQPPAPDEPESLIPISGGFGLIVQLRSGGRVIGVGQAIGMTDEQRGVMLRRAAARAMSQVLGDPAVVHLPEQMKDEIGRSLTLELEIAGQLEPLLGRSFNSILRQLEPGVDGAAMRRGNDWAMLFPSRLLATNTAGAIQTRLAAMAVDLGLELTDDLAALIEQHGVTMYRFRTLHLTQPSPTSAPFETFRGDVTVSTLDVTPQRIASLAGKLVERITGSIWPDHEPQHTSNEAASALAPARAALGIMGDYQPQTDSYQPLIAPPLEQALSCYALLRAASAPGLDEQSAQRAAEGARLVLRDLAHLEPGEQDPREDAAACALILLAVSEWRDALGDDAAIETLVADARRVVAESFDRRTRRFETGRDDGRTFLIPAHRQAMLAAAGARRLLDQSRESRARRADPSSPDADTVRAMIDAAWESVEETHWMSLLPWIAIAEFDFASATDREPANVDRLRRLSEAIERIEAGQDGDRIPRDLIGGLRLAGQRRPTSQTLRPASFLAVLLATGHADLIEAGEAAESILQRQMRTLRFILQLTVRERSLWAYRNPGRARGGVRLSLWDSTQPAATQAMALLVAAETLHGLHERPGR